MAKPPPPSVADMSFADLNEAVKNYEMLVKLSGKPLTQAQRARLDDIEWMIRKLEKEL